MTLRWHLGGLFYLRELWNAYPVYVGMLWQWECRVPDLPGPSGLAWRCRLTWCSVQIQITVSAFNNLAKCSQKIRNIFMSCLPMCLLCCSFTLNVFQHAILSVDIERTVGQKNIWKIISFVYQRQCSAFGRATSSLLPHSLLKCCKNELFPFEINFDLVFCSQPSVAASLF